MSIPAAAPRTLPSTTPVLVSSIFIPVVGLILAILWGQQATQQGASNGPYWKAFGIGFGICIVLWIIFYVVMFAVASQMS